MLVIFPFISLILLFLILWSPNQDWRSATLSATLIWGVLLTAFTELLSLFKLFTEPTVAALWILTTLVCSFIYYRQVKQKQRALQFPKISHLSSTALILIGGVTFILAIVGLIAIVAPPNTWDSMTYHMSRVVHWMQNKTVAHYPTYFLPQLFHPPFAEFAIMHLQILSHSDWFANLVQWFSMLGSIIGVSVIAKQLGAEQRGQIFAAVFCATIPMGILQASSTQNDYAVSFWLVCLAHYVLLGLTETKPSIPILLGIGASVGLAVLTKSSGYVYAFPFLVWFFLVQLIRLRWHVFRQISIVTAVFLVLNISHYLRNIDLFGTPLGTPANFAVEYKIEVYSVPTFISNVIRNLSLHADLVRHLQLEGIIEPTTGKVAKLIEITHNILGVDPNDPRTTWKNYTVPGISLDENVAGNPLHLFLILIAFCLLIYSSQTRQNKRLLSYSMATVAGFLLVCLMLKIQPYQSRHHLAAFVLLSSTVGLVYSQTINRRLVAAIAILLLLTSMPWVFENKFRPILSEQNIFNTSRTDLYFINRPFLKDPYIEAVDFIKTNQKCPDIGLSLGTGETVGNAYWEYPFWVLLQQDKNNKFRIKHINPENISNQKSQVDPHTNFNPCEVISVRLEDEKINKLVTPQGTFVQEWSSDPVSVLRKE